MNQRKRIGWAIYSVLGEFDADKILEVAKEAIDGSHNGISPKREFVTCEGSFLVSMTSLRYQTFIKGKTCVICGLQGTVMRLEFGRELLSPIRITGAMPHFNLYGVKDGHYVMMTKDHIIPVSKGGRDHIDNLQTMCEKCNGKKGNSLPGEPEIVPEPQPQKPAKLPVGNALSKATVNMYRETHPDINVRTLAHELSVLRRRSFLPKKKKQVESALENISGSDPTGLSVQSEE